MAKMAARCIHWRIFVTAACAEEFDLFLQFLTRDGLLHLPDQCLFTFATDKNEPPFGKLFGNGRKGVCQDGLALARADTVPRAEKVDFFAD